MAPNARRTLAGMAAGAALLASGGASAAPQVLALVETPQPVALNCLDGTCSAEFSAFCLQKRRSAPAEGTAYRPAEGTRLTLVLTGADGSVRRMAAGPEVRLHSVRTFTSIGISIPESAVRESGAVKVALSVPENASAVPVAVAGDASPLSADEIAQYTGPLRRVAGRYHPGDGEGAVVARAMNRLLNANQPASYSEDVDTGALWEKAMGPETAAGDGPEIKAAAAKLAACHADSMRVGYLLNQCLQQEHDIIMSETARNVWQALEPGS